MTNYIFTIVIYTVCKNKRNIYMQLSSIMLTNNTPSFQAKLKINDDDNVLSKYDREALHHAASMVGTDKDTIEINFGNYFEGEEHTWSEQGDGWFQAHDDDFVCVNVESNIDNKTKSTDIGVSAYYTVIADNIVKDVTEYFEKLAGNSYEVDMSDFWKKNQKAQDRYARKHHLGRFSKD